MPPVKQDPSPTGPNRKEPYTTSSVLRTNRVILGLPPKTAYRAADSNLLDFAQEDRVPDAVLNDILWHAVRGNTPEPPFSAFDARHIAATGDDDRR